MIDFIVKYWLQVFFGLLASGIGVIARHYYRKYKKAIQCQKSKEQEALEKMIDEKITPAIQDITNRINNLETEFIKRMESNDKENAILRDGLLSIQGESFKHRCRVLLEENHEVTELEWLQLETDYAAYEKLGGNGQGHELYNAVAHKYYHMQQ